MKLDTVQLTTSVDYLREFDKNKFYENDITRRNNNIKCHSLDNKPWGLETLSINETSGSIIMKVNSKILGKDYSKSIQLNTLDQVLNSLNQTGIKLDPSFLDDAAVREIHATDDIRVFDPVASILAFQHLLAPKFIKTAYDHEGIVFKERILQGLYTTVYNKFYQMSKDRKFFKQNPFLAKQFENMLRIESKLTRANLINKYTGGGSLPEILSRDSPNGVILNKIIAGQTLYKPDLLHNLSWKDQKDIGIAKLLFEHYNGNFELIKEHLRNQVGKNTKPNYLFNQYKAACFKLLNIENPNMFDSVLEVLAALNNNNIEAAA
ncbi:hypothetical protein C8P64_0159 [Christiangramia gaetbulicola]|uniref:Uncharacterized protein n=1 Tax=Christiangramia gaetbulicola TaxID=703340 RepID=A0A2T6AK42_9FLAO|nr:hypothetical protein [Christiangramia gaetbulicola]PTX44189.1 hypothetical protein C8P64_0159 [Christiangramia gaetbulicola]